MYGIILFFHVVVCMGLIIIVLLQVGKGAGISGLFGGGSSNDAVFGGTSTPLVIRKITITMAVAFMVTSLLLTIVASRAKMRSVTDTIPVNQAASQQAQPPATQQQSLPDMPAATK
ncbi:MAG: Protein-export membrane protein SecG [Elusimicrobia bacterium ADurb.Bin231]|nr:MAG: Protein-export membrane protein SecG [Elusimicrobia bacterium ADurb.Bin231]